MGIFSSKPNVKKVVLITGASSGIGKSAALELIRRGHIVYGAARRLDKMQDLVQAGGHAIAMDVCKTEQVTAGIERIVHEHKKIDVLINNAGFGLYGAVETVPLSEARRQFDVNLFGLADITQQVVPYMRQAKSGTIINMSSMCGKVYLPFGAWYIATKHALEGFSDCLRLELSAFNINVVIVEPGVIATEFDSVMSGPLIESTTGTVYEKPAKKFADGFDDGSISSSPPSVIANVIVKAVESKRPRRRYMAGSMAHFLVSIRNWFGEGFYDKIILGTVK